MNSVFDPKRESGRHLSVEPTAKPATPYFTLYPSRLRDAVGEFRVAFPDAELCYALKANPHRAVLETLYDEGCGFEAASWGEIELLHSIGVHATGIVYGTSVKPRAHVMRAVGFGIDRFAADSREELDMLGALAPGARVLIRGRVDDSRSVFHLSTKFGASMESLASLVRHALTIGLKPWGLSFHVGSEATDAAAWASGVTAIAPVLEELRDVYDVEVEVLNLGGGFPAVYDNHPEAPDLEAISTVTYQAIETLQYRPKLMLEPGRALVAAAVELTATVQARVEREEGTWLFLDAGAYNALFEALSAQGSTRYPVRREDPLTNVHRKRFVLAGPTGDGLDVISEVVDLPGDTSVGHRLVFANSGAYTYAMACAFNGFGVAPLRVEDERTREPTGLIDANAETIAARLAIGFPDQLEDWSSSPAVYSEHELRILGHPIMQDWEASYMGTLAEAATARGGSILEVGFGLGLSAERIQATPSVTRHVVIECHPDVVAHCLDRWRSAIAHGRMNVLTGFWQDVRDCCRFG